jgi:hypothetical protein
VFGVLVSLGWLDPAAAQSGPATVADAARVLDLRKTRLVPKAKEPGSRTVAHLFYEAPATVKDAYAFHVQALAQEQWKKLDGSYVSDDAASATFQREGFKLSLSVMPATTPGAVNVTITNHGNVDTAKLPVPDKSAPFFATPVSAAYLVEGPVDQAAADVRGQLQAKQWQPYGEAGDVTYFKQAAVRLAARVAAAPAQNGKTFVEYSTEQMSADLPAPPEAKQVQYAEGNTQLSFDTAAKIDDVFAFYRQSLARLGWEATTQQAIQGRFESELLFRSPQKDLLTLTLREVDDVTRGMLRYQSAAEVAEIAQLAKTAAAKTAPAEMPAEETAEIPAEEQSAAPIARVEVPLPANARSVEAAKESLEFEVPAGKGRAAADALRKHFLAAGWQEETAVMEKISGNVTFTKESSMMTMVYADIGIEAAQITIMAIGSELAVQRPAKKK